MQGADPDTVSSKAIKRGMPQSGTLESENHFLEIQVVREICDQSAAPTMSIKAIGQVVVLHSYRFAGIGSPDMQ